MRRNGDVEALANALKNPFLANRAARALGEMRDERAIEPLIGALQDSNEDVRCEAARALGEIGDPRAEESLKKASHDEYRQVRDTATGAIKRIHKSA
jgi:HEAT repeat protein